MVVNAAGPQARSVGALAGVALPVDPYRRSVYVTDTFSGLPPEIPMTLEFEENARAFPFLGRRPGGGQAGGGLLAAFRGFSFVPWAST